VLKPALITLLLLAQIVPLHARAEELGGVEVTAVERRRAYPTWSGSAGLWCRTWWRCLGAWGRSAISSVLPV